MKFNTKTITDIKEILVEEVRRRLEEGEEVTFNELEQDMRKLFQQIGQESLGEILSLQDGIEMGVRVECQCGNQAERISRRGAQVLSIFDWLQYRRSYYQCSECGQTRIPLDEEQGLKPGQPTQGMANLLALAGVIEPFAKASEIVERYLLVLVSDNTIRKESQQVGQKQAQREAEWKQRSQDIDDLHHRERTAKERPKRRYGSIDGAFVPLSGEWKEAKTISWYQSGVPYGQKEPQAQDIRSYISLDRAREFGDLVWASAVHHHVDLAEEVIFVCDGAAWIWKLVEFYFPEAVQIVDWYHACEYLYPIADALYGSQSEQAKAWVQEMKDLLWDGDTRAVIHNCRILEDHVQAGEPARKATTYYVNNQSRMDYPRYREQGYFIGSGAVESACKQIVTMRLKCPGARWTFNGALATAKARTAWLNNQWDHVCSLPLAV